VSFVVAGFSWRHSSGRALSIAARTFPKVGGDAIVTPQSGVAHDIPAKAFVSGAPAVDHRLWLKYSAILPRLPEIVRVLRRRNKSDNHEGH
jgi:UDP-3-O-[3-hydroxymyristoyl] glucosamine N-acyltransferase